MAPERDDLRRPLIAATLGPLDDPPRAAMDRLRELGCGFVQLSASQPGLRPRELSRTARRELSASLRRRELLPSGLDAWVPPEHLLDSRHADRAVAAIVEAIELAGDLDRCPISVTLPDARDLEADQARLVDEIASVLSSAAERRGVRLADHAVGLPRRPGLGVGVDPAAVLASGLDPAAAVLGAGPELACVRVVDLLSTGTRGPIGSVHGGRLDVAAYRAAVSVAAPHLPVVIDARTWSDPWSGIERSVRAWRELDQPVQGSFRGA